MSEMLRTSVRTVCVAAGLGLAFGLSPLPTAAQITVFPIQGLAFGTLQPGVDERVLPTDADRRGEVEIRGTGRLSVRMRLPLWMTSSSGQRLPIQFRSGDGRYSWLKNGREWRFDPTRPTRIRIPQGQQGARLFFGGTARPAAGQAAGIYRALITIQVSNTGT